MAKPLTNAPVGGNASAGTRTLLGPARRRHLRCGRGGQLVGGISPADRTVGARPRSLAITWMALAAEPQAEPHKTAEGGPDDPAQLDTYEDRQQHPEGFNRTVRSSPLDSGRGSRAVDRPGTRQASRSRRQRVQQGDGHSGTPRGVRPQAEEVDDAYPDREHSGVRDARGSQRHEDHIPAIIEVASCRACSRPRLVPRRPGPCARELSARAASSRARRGSSVAPRTG